jgi:hypothetical protein
MDPGEIRCEGLTDSKLLKTGTSGNFCEHGDKPSGFLKAGNFLNSRVNTNFLRPCTVKFISSSETRAIKCRQTRNRMQMNS